MMGCRRCLRKYVGIRDKHGRKIRVGDVLRSWYSCGNVIADDLVVSWGVFGGARATNGYRSVNWGDCEIVVERSE